MKAAKAGDYLICSLAILLCVTFFLGLTGPAQEAGGKSDNDKGPVRLIPSLEGADLFHHYCASCHGADGKGQGPVTPALNTKVPDLTTIAKRNGGIFPTRRIERLIAGDEAIIAHGSRERLS